MKIAKRDLHQFKNMSEDEKASYRIPSSPWNPRTIRIIQKHIELKQRESYKAHKIRKFILKREIYNYKTGSSRPNKYGTNMFSSLKCSIKPSF